MGLIPALKPREVAALLEAHGFVEIRQRGSHRQYRHPDGRGTTIPFHAGRDISPTLLRKMHGTSGSRWRNSSLEVRRRPNNRSHPTRPRVSPLLNPLEMIVSVFRRAS